MFEICEWGCDYYNLNASLLHDDPFSNGSLRAMIRGIPAVTRRDSTITSILAG